MAELTKAMLKEIDSWVDSGIDTEFIETGNIGFDMAISNGKGLPLGSSILFWGKPGCGKTTLFADVAKRLIQAHKAQGVPFKVLYIAVESSPELMKKLGLAEYIKTQDFLYVGKRLTWSQVETLYDAVIEGKGKYKDVKLIVIDSTNNVLSDQNVKNSVSSGDFGTKAKERTNFWSKYLPLCKEKKITTFMVTQMRQKQNAGLGAFVETEKAAASFADLHNADVILKCKTASNNLDATKLETGTAYGSTKSQKKYILILDPTNSASKNRIDETYPCEILLEKGVGAHNYYVVRKMLLFHGFLKKDGAWYSFPKEVAEALEFPEKKMYLSDVNNLIKDNIGKLVALLKEANCYSIVSSSKEVKEIAGTEDTDEVGVEQTCDADEEANDEE